MNHEIDRQAIAYEIKTAQDHCWKFKASDTIADRGLHAKLTVGEPLYVKPLRADMVADIANFTIILSCDDDVCEQGRGSNALDSPLKAVGHLINVIAKQPHTLPLQSGGMVTTGTQTAACSIHPGQTWNTNLKGIELPDISVSFEE